MANISRIKKRDGRIDEFDQNKITEAIYRAAQSVGGTDHGTAEKIGNQVTAFLEVFFKDPEKIPTVEQIQDLVEKILIENGHAKTAKAYILYREKHNKLRELLSRINYTETRKAGRLNEKQIQNSTDFTLINITTEPESVVEALRKTLPTSQKQVAINFSSLETAKNTPDLLTYLKIFDGFGAIASSANSATDTTQGNAQNAQGKKITAILNIDHPAILELIKLQSGDQKIENLTILIGITPEFIEAVKNDGQFDLKNPQTGEKIETINARQIIELIIDEKEKNNSLGLMFFSETEKPEEIMKELKAIQDQNLDENDHRIEEIIPPPIQAMI
ncbi:MAG: ATP cone domain-containing protein [Candidatus Gracilibacteria bacterium]|jgi:hypothetical protein